MVHKLWINGYSCVFYDYRDFYRLFLVCFDDEFYCLMRYFGPNVQNPKVFFKKEKTVWQAFSKFDAQKQKSDFYSNV